jgi:hypothetical protein
MRRRQRRLQALVTGVFVDPLASRAGFQRRMHAGRLQARSETPNALPTQYRHCVARPEQCWVPAHGRGGEVLAYLVHQCAAIRLRSS